MWPFKRQSNQNQSDVPKEVQQYYQSERRERTGIAWLLALATLAVTVVLALVLFFGGRWLYRTFFGNNGQNSTGTTQQEQTDNSDEDIDTSILPGDGNENGNGEASEGSQSDTQNGGSNGETGPESEGQTTPSTGASDLPRTGPEGELF